MISTAKFRFATLLIVTIFSYSLSFAEERYFKFEIDSGIGIDKIPGLVPINSIIDLKSGI